MHVPSVINVTSLPFVPPVVHTELVSDANVTGLPESPPLALTVIGESERLRMGNRSNVMTCGARGVTLFEAAEAGSVPTPLVVVTVKV